MRKFLSGLFAGFAFTHFGFAFSDMSSRQFFGSGLGASPADWNLSGRCIRLFDPSVIELIDAVGLRSRG